MQRPLFFGFEQNGYQKTILFISLVIVAVIAWPLKFYYLNDDLIHIPLAGSGKVGHHNSVRYIGDVSLMLDNFIYGKKAGGYHLTNLVLHILNVILFWLILTKITKDNNDKNIGWPILYTCLIFALFGFHNDAIFWIIGRSASLGCLFFLLSLFSLLNLKKGFHYKLVAILCWIAALFSYESVWIFPFLLLLAWQFFKFNNRDSSGNSSSLIFLFWLIFAIYLIIRKGVTSEWLGTYEADSFQTFNFGTLLINYLKLIARTIVPPFEESKIFLLFAAISIILIGSLITAVFLKKLHNKYWVFIQLSWLISYLPYLSLGISATSIESERFLYLPSIFFAASICYSLYLVFKKNIIAFHLTSFIIIVFNAYHFYKASNYFRQNGELVRNTFSLLNEKRPIGLLEIKNLPHTIHGIPVFRSGFTEGFNWLVSPAEQTKIIVTDSIERSSFYLKPVIKPAENRVKLTFEVFNP